MSVVTSRASDPVVTIGGETANPVSRKVPIVFTAVTVIAVLAAISARSGDTAFRFTRSSADPTQLPEMHLPVCPTLWVIAVLLAVGTLFAWRRLLVRRKVPMWLVAVYGTLAVIGFLVWAGVGHAIPLVGLLGGALSLAVPLVYGALAGVIGERVGVVNIAIEAQLLSGAFTAAIVSSVTKQPLLALPAAMVTGMLVGMVLAAFSLKYLVDQVIVGVVLNVLVIGLTSFLYSQVLVPHADQLNTPVRLDALPIPLLSDIPVIGPVFFRQTIVVYLMYVAVAVVAAGLFRTRWGLRLRAVGEHPKAADTVGIKVISTRLWNVALAGAIAGLGGTFFTIGSGIAFNKQMTAGMGYIALAAVIFGKWHPIKATLAALLFGFASNLQNTLSVIGSPVPSEFMLMLPYVVTILAVAGLVGKSRAPAASGKPYVKG